MSSLADTVAHFAALLQDGEGGPRAAEVAALVAALCAARHIQMKVGDTTLYRTCQSATVWCCEFAVNA